MIKESKVISTLVKNIYCDDCEIPLSYHCYVKEKEYMNPETGVVKLEGYYNYKCPQCGKVLVSHISYPLTIQVLGEPIIVEEEI